MVSNVKVIGLKGDAPFQDIIDHFLSLGGDVVLMDPTYIYGVDHVLSSVEHAERAFRNGTNRSKTILTEIMMYAAGERQISNALKKMKPKSGNNEYVAVVLDVPGDIQIDKIGMIRDDSVIDGTPEKAKAIGLVPVEGASFDDLILEKVALLDIAKI